MKSVLFEFFSPFLVILSVFTAIISSYIALVLTQKINGANRVQKRTLTIFAAWAVGVGIFTMHFTGMAASNPTIRISYNPLILGGSLAASILGAYGAFYFLYFKNESKWKSVFSSLLLGAGIFLGHYIAVLAVREQMDFQINLLNTALSLIMAFVFSSLATRLFILAAYSKKSIARKSISAVVLGLSVAVMHYSSTSGSMMELQTEGRALNYADYSLLLFVLTMILFMIFLAVFFAVLDYRSLASEKQLQETLKESEERFRRLVELSPEPIVVQSDGDITFVNQACLNLVNAQTELDLVGKRVLDFVPKENREAIKQRISSMISGEDETPIEQKLVVPGGKALEVEIRGARMEFEGNPSIQLILRNITEQQRVRRKLEESEQRYQSLFLHNPEGVYSMDARGKMLNVNQALVDMLGYTRAEFGSLTFHEIVKPEFLPETIRNFELALKGTPRNYELVGIHRTGDSVPFHITNLPIIVDNEIIGVFGIAKNISKEKKAIRLLEENEEKYRSLFEQNLDAVFELDMDGNFTNVNHNAEKLTGYTKQELHAMAFPALIAENLQEVQQTFTLTKNGKSLRSEQKLVDKFGKQIEVDVNVVPMTRQGRVEGAFSIARDVTEKKRIEKKVNDLAFTDQLTGLPNRHWFYENLSKTAERAQQLNRSLAVVIIDFDDFKGVNDLLGHHGGDLFLQHVSERIKNCLRPSDRLSRHGGDEFIVVLEDADENYLERLSRKIIKEMNRPVILMDHDLVVTISIGISFQSNCTCDAGMLIRQADFALYSAKEKGKNNYQFYTDDLNEKATRKFQIENALRKAIDNGEFLLYYQPQIDLQSNRLVGLEALLRWQSPFGMVQPNEFIPIAEETGLILPIGEWVLDEACRQLKEWERLGFPLIKVSVNASARQFRDPNFSRKVDGILKKHQVDTRFFEIEITESVMFDVEEASQLMEELRKLGIKIAIDDFGAGFSSLTVIKNISIDTLKIDKSLIDDIIGNHRNLAILSAIIQVGKNLQTEVVAEGIETKEQMELLKSFNVTGQGYYFSKPALPEQFEKEWQQEKVWSQQR
ncbi:diguanylate cyclase (GGDEF)-like protein/PAS domain S-box-containing protein [Planomicrobium koreense]|uniref:Diguanylate cyclase (GGDEF)-like protein/PAS domain S-box-containing protein n=1 Tax=Planococcus koreensis TaxID=112331 RepID=A0A7W8FRQ8_9BACL|nr:EAL domain-containing protein [Planococcus koreensis]MBB5179769.1 diguanylate cyclase (GGDEF)-like protein/PAS domain S-box-containing protein [Planococcus koreensis]